MDDHDFDVDLSRDLELIIRRRDRVHLGDDVRDLDRAVRRGELLSVAPGCYVPGATWARLSPARRHRVRVLAAVHRLPSDPVLSHFAAAALWGLESWRPWPSAIDVLVPNGRGRSSGSIRRHPTDVSRHETVALGDLTVTAPAQTAVDIATVVPFGEAVVTVDSALRSRGDAGPLTSPRELADAVSRIAGTAGSARAEAAVRFASDRSGSAVASMSRVRIAEAGFPEPELRQPHPLPGGTDVLVDFSWPEQDVVGVVHDDRCHTRADGDGARHSRRWLDPRGHGVDALSALGTAVARWGRHDIVTPGRLVSILRTAGLRASLDRPDRPGPSG